MKKTREQSLLRLFVSSFTFKKGIVVSSAANMFLTNTFLSSKDTQQRQYL